MAKIKQDFGSVGGGDVTYEYVSGTWPASGSNVIPTTQKAKSFIITDNSSQVWFAKNGDTYCTRNGALVTSYPVTFNSNNITIGGNYGSTASYKGYVIY